ncbi:gala protein [Streptomyces sp. NBC_00059]|uniref:gala protein n=1 Tax=Streptomyces sp. NBC_00059 TaxID=2975635 RepID=UPI002258697D|nr:gala protein [Streptomyces sp. NBC_00059]MCX5417567.1 gala protein [Streptomyces sp. NBC_00059]
MSQPMPVRCPAIEHPDVPLVDVAALNPLVERLGGEQAVGSDEVFPVGTLRADGRVDLCKQGLGAAGAALLMPALARSPHAGHVLLGTNSLGDEGACSVADALRDVRGHGLRTVYLGCNRIGAEGAAALAGALSGDSTVRALWLKRNPLGDTGVRALVPMLARTTSLRTLDLVNTGVTTAGLEALLDALTSREQPLERLFLGGNGLGPDAAPLLAALIRDAGVRELYVPANHLGDAGAAVLAASAGPERPVRLGLGGNGIGPAGAGALADALDGIEALDLGRPMSQRSLGAAGNATGDAGAHALALALPGSPLRRLELAHTGLTGRGAKALLGAVGADCRLEYVGLGPGLPRKVKRSFATRLRPDHGAHPDLRAIRSVYR